MTVSSSWGGGASSASSVASSTTHSFETDSSLSVGAPDLFGVGGATVSSDFNYNRSSANSTLNNYSIAQTTSTGKPMLGTPATITSRKCSPTLRFGGKSLSSRTKSQNWGRRGGLGGSQ